MPTQDVIVLAGNRPPSKIGALSQSPTFKRARSGRATTASALAAAPDSLSLCHGCDGRPDRMAVTAGDRPDCGLRTTDGCSQTTAGSRRRASLTDESRTAGGSDLELVLLAVPEIAPGDDVRPRDGREGCASHATGRVSTEAREARCWRLHLWMLVQEPDVDPARVPEATGAPIRRHRRRDRN